MKKRLAGKSKKKILKSIVKIEMVLMLLLVAIGFGKIPGTNSFFTDTATVAGNTLTAGYWIPELTMSYAPSSPDGDNGFFKTAPCVTLEAKLGGSAASLSEVDIYYEFSNDGDPVSGGTAYSGACVPVPDGNPTHFQAIAVNKLNFDWKSNLVSGQFKVDTQCPFVKITNPDGRNVLSGSVEVKGTVTDANPHHYWLVIENSSGTKVAGPGTVNDTNSFTDKKFFDWDTTAVSDGNYKIKLEARDAAGNKCPDLAPVPADPNNPNDSVDWISVAVDNTSVKAGDVVINEVMWMGSTESGNDEWIELRNMTGHDIDIKNWNIYGAVSGSGGHLEIAGGSSDVIPAHGYFLISNFGKSGSAIDVDVDLTATNISFNNNYNTNGQLILKDKSGNTIDATPTPTGGSWPEGYYAETTTGLHQSMERNSTPGDGTLAGSWHTCTSDGCNDTIYWDSEGNNYGTPGAANLSENDPTADDYKPEKDEDEPGDPVILENAAPEEVAAEDLEGTSDAVDPESAAEEVIAEGEDEGQAIEPEGTGKDEKDISAESEEVVEKESKNEDSKKENDDLTAQKRDEKDSGKDEDGKDEDGKDEDGKDEDKILKNDNEKAILKEDLKKDDSEGEKDDKKKGEDGGKDDKKDHKKEEKKDSGESDSEEK